MYLWPGQRLFRVCDYLRCQSPVQRWHLQTKTEKGLLICKDSSECAAGTCQPSPLSDGSEGDDFFNCLLNRGDETEDSSSCASESTCDDQGTLRCTYILGGDCSKNSEICSNRSQCVGGICKRAPGYSGKICSESTEYAEGVCQKGDFGNGPYYFLGDGEVTPNEGACKSGDAYEENGQLKCSYNFGGDCP